MVQPVVRNHRQNRGQHRSASHDPVGGDHHYETSDELRHGRNDGSHGIRQGETLFKGDQIIQSMSIENRTGLCYTFSRIIMPCGTFLFARCFDVRRNFWGILP